MATKRYVKDPDAVLDYPINWASSDGTNDGSSSDTGWLQGDTISTATFTVDSGITKDSESNTTTTATVWLSGGTAGQRYTVTCRITTTSGRTEDQSIQIICKEK